MRIFRILLIFAALFPFSVLAAYNCTVSTTGLQFGQYRPLSSTNHERTGTIQVQCSLLGLVGLLVSYEISFNTGGSGTYTNRRLLGPVNTLNYNLYKDASRTIILGNGTGGTQTITDGYLLSLTPLTRTYTIYGRIPANQNVRTGSYSDSILVTVTY